MCEQIYPGIEHAGQTSFLAASADTMTDQHKEALLQRIDPKQISAEGLFSAMNRVTQQQLLYRHTHELANAAKLGIIAPQYDAQPSQLWLEYDNMIGRPEKIGHFVSWFSHVSHTAYVQQENLPPRNRFKHVSSELGGFGRQFGDWEATKDIDAMVRTIPEELLNAEPILQRMDIFGEAIEGRIDNPKIHYLKDVDKNYLISPHWQSPDEGMTLEELANDPIRNLYFEYLKVRRRRPVADIFIENQSDIVIFKESWGLIPMSMLAPMIQTAIRQDVTLYYLEAYEMHRQALLSDPEARQPKVKITDTRGSRLAGTVLELAIKSAIGVTNNVFPMSAHYVQAVGNKYTDHRKPSRQIAA